MFGRTTGLWGHQGNNQDQWVTGSRAGCGSPRHPQGRDESRLSQDSDRALLPGIELGTRRSEQDRDHTVTTCDIAHDAITAVDVHRPRIDRSRMHRPGIDLSRIHQRGTSQRRTCGPRPSGRQEGARPSRLGRVDPRVPLIWPAGRLHAAIGVRGLGKIAVPVTKWFATNPRVP